MTTMRGKGIFYYACYNRLNNKSCNQENLRADKVDEFLLNEIKKAFNENVLNDLKEKLEKELNQHLKQIEEERKALQQALNKINRKIDNIVDAIAEGIIDKETAKLKMQTLKEEKRELEDRLHTLKHIKTVKVQIDIEEIRQAIEYFLSKSETKRVRNLLKQLISKITYDEKVFEIEYNLSVAFHKN